MDKVVLGFRSVARMPMGAFDAYRNLYNVHPRTLNFIMLYAMFPLLFIAGKGSEKFTMKGEAS